MSTRYQVYDANHPHKDQVIDSLPKDSLDSHEVVDRMNKMQDVIDVAGDVISDSRKATDAAIVVSGTVIAELMRRLEALKPKTTEQLLAERLKAADHLVMAVRTYGDMGRRNAADAYADAANAHEASL